MIHAMTYLTGKRKIILLACSILIVSVFILVRTETGMLHTARPCILDVGGSECDTDFLCDENMNKCTPLMGNIDRNHDQLITRVLGVKIPYLLNNFYRGKSLRSAIFVFYSESISKIPYHDYLVEEARKVLPPWQTTFGWEIQDGDPVLKVRITNSFGDKSFTELWYDGNTGEFIKRVAG
jgi:hypothetical protein